jgi:hypothetical protein
MATSKMSVIRPNSTHADSGRYRITPDQARVWLDNKLHNRRVHQSKLRDYADAMKSGRWLYDGEPLIFDAEGKLMDGQHRLLACVEAGVPFETYCVFGIDREAMVVLDTGAMRSPGDTLDIMRGVDNAKMVAAALNWSWVYESGRSSQYVGKAQMPRDLLLDYADKHPAIKDSLPYGYKAKKFLPPASATALHYLMAQKDQELADEFFSALVLGENLHTGEGMYVLRKRLQNDWGAKLRMAPVYKCALTVKIWNDWRRGVILRKTLRWRIGLGQEEEKFPEVE